MKYKCDFCGRSVDNHEMNYHLSKYHPELMEAGKLNQIKINQIHKPKMRKIVVDGNNVAYYFGSPKVHLIKKIRIYLKKNEYFPVIIISEALIHNIDDKDELQRLINIGWVILADSSRDDDNSVIEHAIPEKLFIITNDRYESHRSTYEGKYDFSNLHTFSFVNNEVKIFPRL